MWMMTYDGGWADTSARHPDQFTVLAPQRLQEKCRAIGGTNHRGEARFRLVVLQSRYMISGGLAVTFLDLHGNYQKQIPAEIFIPRYQAEEIERELYLLEQWRSPQWYYENGFGDPKVAMEWTVGGKTVRCLEPIWPDGGYEATFYEGMQMFVFPRNLSPDNIVLQWAICSVLRAAHCDKKRVLSGLRDETAKRREKDIEEATEVCLNERSNLFIEPAISLAGMRGDLWKRKESSVLEQVTN